MVAVGVERQVSLPVLKGRFVQENVKHTNLKKGEDVKPGLLKETRLHEPVAAR
jgi:hypothetical protein